MTRLRVGLIGCGRVSEHVHLPALKGLAQATVVALADPAEDRLRQLGEQSGVQRLYTDYRELLADPEVDVVGICAPPHLHAEIALAGLEALKHLLIEKPLAVSADEAQRLERQAMASPVKVAVGFNLRWHRQVLRVRALLAEGSVGRPWLLRSVFTTALGPHDELPAWRCEAGGDVLLEIAVHHFDLWSFLLDTEVEEVYAVGPGAEGPGPGGLHTSVAVTAKMANGVVASGIFSLAAVESHAVEVYTESRRLALSIYGSDGIQLTRVSDRPDSLRNRARRASARIRAFPHAFSSLQNGGDFRLSYRNEWTHLFDCIREDRCPACGVRDGRRALEVSLAAAESAARAAPVRVAHQAEAGG